MLLHMVKEVSFVAVKTKLAHKMVSSVLLTLVHTIKGEIVSHFKKVAYKKNMKEEVTKKRTKQVPKT